MSVNDAGGNVWQCLAILVQKTVNKTPQLYSSVHRWLQSSSMLSNAIYLQYNYSSSSTSHGRLQLALIFSNLRLDNGAFNLAINLTLQLLLPTLLNPASPLQALVKSYFGRLLLLRGSLNSPALPRLELCAFFSLGIVLIIIVM